GAGLTGEPVIECELEALLPGVVDVGEAEQVPGHLTARVIAAVLARAVDPGDAESLDLRGLGGLAVAGQVEKLAVEIARDAPCEFLTVELQRRGEARNLVGGERQLARIDPQG